MTRFLEKVRLKSSVGRNEEGISSIIDNNRIVIIKYNYVSDACLLLFCQIKYDCCIMYLVLEK